MILGIVGQVNIITHSKVFSILCATLIIIWLRMGVKSGLHIEDNYVFYKFFSKKEIDISSIAAIKICQVYRLGGRFMGYYPMKNENGEIVYSMFLMSKIDEKMINHDFNNVDFKSEYRGCYIICEVIYDREAANYLKTLNPNIKIIW